jgi:UDP-glucose 4-epimerase
MSMKWLVTGGAGYIGSHVVRALLNDGLEVIVLDSLISGNLERLSGSCEVVIGDVRDEELVSETIRNHRIEGVINLAALKSVEESKEFPQKYQEINHHAMKKVLDIALQNNVPMFIQSSTAAVYGNSKSGFVTESDKLNPISPYGITKAEAENELNMEIGKSKLLGCSLRYFNVIGAATATLKDSSRANIFPMVMDAIERKQPPKIFGNDYPTKDGTCVRDYVHVEDIARAHVAVVKSFAISQIPVALNIGTGIGYSVREVMNEILKQVGSSREPVVVDRRQGDPAMLVANVDLAEEVLGFKTQKTLEEMIASSI